MESGAAAIMNDEGDGGDAVKREIQVGEHKITLVDVPLQFFPNNPWNRPSFSANHGEKRPHHPARVFLFP